MDPLILVCTKCTLCTEEITVAIVIKAGFIVPYITVSVVFALTEAQLQVLLQLWLGRIRNQWSSVFSSYVAWLLIEITGLLVEMLKGKHWRVSNYVDIYDCLWQHKFSCSNSMPQTRQ